MVMAPFSEWPWKNLGSYKYILYVPLVANALYCLVYEKDGQSCNWCLHVLILCALRGLVHQQWSSFSSMFFLTRRRTIIKQQADFKQIDKEWHWDDCLILHAHLATWAHYIMPSLRDLPLWNFNGLLLALVLHIGLSEPLYYWAHKKLHSGLLFAAYHSIHHSSAVPHSFTASHATPLEHLILNVVVGVPILGAVWMGFGSMSLIYVHLLTFDFLRCMGHSNVEVLPHKIFLALPFLKYLIYTSTYHSLHHREMRTNLCLFMPLFDKIGGTLNNKSWALHAQISSGENSERALDFVFLAHIVDFTSCPHVPFIYRSLASLPFATHLFYLPFWLLAWIILPLMWAFAKTFLVSSYKLRHHLQQTWVVPRFGLLYFVPFAKPGINYHIEQAILRADRLGVKVISLAALNKNEALNGGGALFVKRNTNLKVRVAHGNTLTAAAILHDIPKDCKEVFLTGATSKLGRAIALYLCRLNVRVMMLTLSTERFQRIQREAPYELQHNLIHVTKYQAAKNCKTWIVGKWLSIKDQRWAPRGTQFHQFVVPPITPYREDCGYGKLAAMKLPQDVEGLGTCEYKMERGVVHACHAGGLVHCLEGWTHHEVGAIDVDQIDVVWEAALKHGLRPVTSIIPNEN